MIKRQLPRAARICISIAASLLIYSSAFASVSGTIYTSTASGSTVNGNIYANKADVYLNGGPQNKNDPGIVPDGIYYFMVTDPSGAVLLSLDNISCRQVVVSGGMIVGVPTGPAPAECVDGYHDLGTTNLANGQTPVQLCNPDDSKCATDFADTPNPGGEYKVWLTPVDKYSPEGTNNCSSGSNIRFGFCDADSKTDNFKIRKPQVAYISVCKFNDLNGNAVLDVGEPLLPGWEIAAQGVDTLSGPTGSITSQTDLNGCVSFSISKKSDADNPFSNPDGSATVKLNEILQPGWVETAPLDGVYGATTVADFIETITVKPGDYITAPNFGNTCIDFNQETGCGGNNILVVTKDANPSIKRTYTWELEKSATPVKVYSAGGAESGSVYFTITPKATATDSEWTVNGVIKVHNPSVISATNVTVTDEVDNGALQCTISIPMPITVAANSTADVPYNCTYASLPVPGTNKATATWAGGAPTGTAPIDFTGAPATVFDDTITITDPTSAGSPWTRSVADQSPINYSQTYTDPAGTCTKHYNTASFTSDPSTKATPITGSSNTVTTEDCQGADLTISKTATPAYKSNITKDVDKTTVDTTGSGATFNYTVNVTTSEWTVKGEVTVSNPNDWQAIDATLTDTLDGATCVFNENSLGSIAVTVPASGSVSKAYTCSWATEPNLSASTNHAKVTWNGAAAHTPHSEATAQAGFTFEPLTVTDTFDSVTTILGSVTFPPGKATFNYSHTVANAPPGACKEYTNTAIIVETSQEASQKVKVCSALVTVLKTTDGLVDPTQNWSFSIYAGANGYLNAPLATENVNGLNDGLLTFGQLSLAPGLTYTLCETNVAIGWTPQWSVDPNNTGTFNPLTPYKPAAGYECVDFGAGTTLALNQGGTLPFKVDNVQDKGYLKIRKIFDPKTSGFAGTFTIHYSCLDGSSGDALVAGGTSATVGPLVTHYNGSPNACTVTEPTLPTPPVGWVFGTPVISGSPATIIKGDAYHSVIVSVTNYIKKLPTLKIIKVVKGGTSTFGYTVSGANTLTTSLNPPSNGSAAYGPVPINIGTSTITETVALNWTLTDVVCTGYTGTAPYDGPGALNKNGVPTIWQFTAKYGDNVVCTYVNEAPKTTRTQGFWSTHTALANNVWNGTSGLPGATQLGVDAFLCNTLITTSTAAGSNVLLGGFFASIPKLTTGVARTAIDKARMQMVQQYLAAVLNVHAFGSGSPTLLANARTAYCGTNLSAIQAQIGILGSFNQSGDNGLFTPGSSATPKLSKTQANLKAWNTPLNPH